MPRLTEPWAAWPTPTSLPLQELPVPKQDPEEKEQEQEGPRLMPGSGGVKVRAVAGLPNPPSSSPAPEGKDEPDNIPDEWTIAYLYDGACPVCQGLKKTLQRTDRAHHIAFVNLAREDYDEGRWGVDRDTALLKIHAVFKDGSVVQGKEAVEALYEQGGLGLLAKASQSPVLSKAAEWAINFASKNR